MTADEEQSLGGAVIFRFIAAAYRYPDPATLDRIMEQKRAVAEALAALADSSDDALSKRFQELLSEAEESTTDSLEQDYTTLFGHVVQSLRPPYETEYSESDERLQQPHELSDLSTFYHAFGLKLVGDIHERVDFVAVECEFSAFLCCKHAYALEHGDEELATIVLNAQRMFMRNHLGRWVPAFARKIIQQSAQSFYHALAQFTLAFVNDDCRRLAVRPGTEHLKLRLPLDEEQACVSCPMAEAKLDGQTQWDGALEV